MDRWSYPVFGKELFTDCSLSKVQVSGHREEWCSRSRNRSESTRRVFADYNQGSDRGREMRRARAAEMSRRPSNRDRGGKGQGAVLELVARLNKRSENGVFSRDRHSNGLDMRPYRLLDSLHALADTSRPWQGHSAHATGLTAVGWTHCRHARSRRSAPPLRPHRRMAVPTTSVPATARSASPVC
jgi:hypothetical protein